jgi:preprotein translocase subunit SecG
MQTILLVIHLLLAVGLVAIVLMQRSEGGALGIGGGDSAFMGARSTANALTRATAVLATAFMATSLGLTMLARHGGEQKSILDTVPATSTSAPAQAPAKTAPSSPAQSPSGPTTTPAPAGPSAPVSP